MQTNISKSFEHVREITEVDSILRSCVHCGFCTATCPTYQLLGDELDSPRGRIYLIKNFLESGDVGVSTQLHLDRCLSCRSCETTCPSGVRYARLLDIGKNLIEKKLGRPWRQRMMRAAIRFTMPYPSRLLPMLKIANFFRPLLPEVIRRKIPAIDNRMINVEISGNANSLRSVIVFEGCVQSLVAQSTNNALREILAKKGIRAVTAIDAGCCSALCQHLSDEDNSQRQMKKNIDAWSSLLDGGAEGILISASGCAAHIKEYAELLKHDNEYATKAANISRRVWDVSEFLVQEFKPAKKGDDKVESPYKHDSPKGSIVFHSPCTLQHGLSIKGIVESLLIDAGYSLNDVEDSHICCGSAGSYSLLQGKLSQALLSNKIKNLQREKPNLIATANIGCQLHLQSATTTPVKHWLELFADRLK